MPEMRSLSSGSRPAEHIQVHEDPPFDGAQVLGLNLSAEFTEGVFRETMRPLRCLPNGMEVTRPKTSSSSVVGP